MAIPRVASISLLLVALAVSACSAHGAEAPSPTPSVTGTASRLTIVKALEGTRADVFAGELAMDVSRNLLFVGEQHDGVGGAVDFRVRVVDGDSLRTIRRIGPGQLRIVDPIRGHVYLEGAAPDQARLKVFDIESGRLLRSLPQSEAGIPPAIEVSKARLYVPRDTSIDVYELPDFRLVERFPLQQRPEGIAIDEAATVLSILQAQPPGVLLLDASTGRRIATVDVGSPAPHTLSAGAGWFATVEGDFESSVLEVHASDGKIAWTKRFPRRVETPSADPALGVLFVPLNDLTNSEGPPPHDPPDVLEMRSLKDGAVLGSVELPEGPVRVAVDPERRHLFVSCLLANSIQVLTY